MSRIGKNAEHLFSEMLTRENPQLLATVNSSADDQNGWDHIVEISLPDNEALPADLRQPLLQCFAQIKATKGKHTKVRLKMSNALKAVQSDLPFFLFLFQTREGCEPKLFGRHVWKEEIGAWLKRARQHQSLDMAGLARKTISLAFNDSDEIEGHLADWIVSELRSVGTSYANEKASIRENAGYSDQRFIGNFSLPTDVDILSFVEHQLGVGENLPVKNVEIFDIRFDIQSHSPVLELSDAKLSLTPKPIDVVVNATDGNECSVSLDGCVTAPTGVAADDLDFGLRCQAVGLDIVITPNRNRGLAHFELSWPENESLLQVARYLKLVECASRSELSFEIESDHGVLSKGTAGPLSEVPLWVEQLAGSGSFVTDLIGEKRSDKIKLNLLEMNDLNRKFHFISKMLGSGSITITGEFPNDIPAFESILGYYYGRVSKQTLGLVFEIRECVVTKDSNKTKIYGSKMRIVWKKLHSCSEQEMKNRLVSEFERVQRDRDGKVAYFFNGDGVELVKSLESHGALALDVS